MTEKAIKPTGRRALLERKCPCCKEREKYYCTYCKECAQAKAKAYREKNLERVKAVQKAYRERMRTAHNREKASD